MDLRNVDMWTVQADHRVIAANSTLNQQGHLVMGAGAAKEAAAIYPFLPELAGRLVYYRCGNRGMYGLLFAGPVWLFQTKQFFGHNADLGLIRVATDMLMWHASREPRKRWVMNFPGIGHGHLDPTDVRAIIDNLPANVTVCWR